MFLYLGRIEDYRRSPPPGPAQTQGREFFVHGVGEKLGRGMGVSTPEASTPGLRIPSLSAWSRAGLAMPFMAGLG